jgi:hypothetical protein
MKEVITGRRCRFSWRETKNAHIILVRKSLGRKTWKTVMKMVGECYNIKKGCKTNRL